MKDYPLYIEYCTEFEGCDVTDYHSKGHHDKTKFIDAVNGDYKYIGKVEDVMHCYCKATPSPTGGMLWNYKKEPCKGSFPVTVIIT